MSANKKKSRPKNVSVPPNTESQRRRWLRAAKMEGRGFSDWGRLAFDARADRQGVPK